MAFRYTLALVSAIGATLLLSNLATADPAWQINGVPVCDAADTQETPCVVSLGAAGTIVFWADRRSGAFDIYAQKLNADGQPLWAPGGVVVCGALYDQQFPAAVPDEAGGAIVVWQDGRLGDDGVDLYAQRINSDGTLAWTADGAPVCTHDPLALSPPIAFSQVVTADGAGGVIVAWRDSRNDMSLGNTEIYVEKVDGSGAAQWELNGVKLLGFTTQTWSTRSPVIAADGAGGAVVLWQDGRNSSVSANDLYAQRVSSDGVVAWAPNGIIVCDADGEQGYPDMIALVDGDVVAAWEDKRSGNYDIYAQRLAPTGAAQWDADGRLVTIAANDQRTPRLVDDALGGVILAWSDGRSNPQAPDIYAQKLNGSGAAQWAANGVTVCTVDGWQGRIRLCAGDSGASILSWTDNRGDPSNQTYYYDVYAQMLSASGAPQWAAGGTVVSAASGTQRLQQVAADGAGGAYVVWEDNRDAGDWDIYAQRMIPQMNPTAVNGVAEAKALEDGRLVTLPAVIVSAAFDGFFYVEDQDRHSGIRVESTQAVNIGDLVSVTGALRTSSERCIEATEVRVIP